MRILHFIGTLRTGGAERQLSVLSRAQAKLGHDVHIAYGESGPFLAEISNGGVHVHLVRKKTNRDVRILRSVQRVVSAVKPGVVQTWLPQMDVTAGLVSLNEGIPWVMTERTCRVAYRMTSITDAARRVLGYRADAIVANSEEGRKMWVRQKDPTRAYLIRNALDFDAIVAAPKASSASIGFSRPFVLAVGRLAEEKNVELLLEVADAVCASTEVNFVLCGEGPQATMVTDTIKRKGRSDRIFLFGLRADVWGLMKSAAALVSTSRFEGQPNVVLEAMACRCPLVVSDIAAHREFLDDSSALIVPPTNKAEFVVSILSTLASKAERSSRTEAALRAVSAYTPMKAAERYDQVYESILSRR